MADIRAVAAPPEDFWIGITVLGPVRSGGADGVSAYDALPRALRPGRYVVEPDRALRAAMGVGAKEGYFPPQTRQLSGAEFAELWRQTMAAGLLDPTHPDLAAGSGEIDPEAIEGKTVYVISAHASGRRELVVMEVEPECGPWCEKAKRVVEWMAGKAWVNPPAAPEKPR